MESIGSFIIAHSELSLTSRRVPRNPHMDESGSMDNWRCTLRMGNAARQTLSNIQHPTSNIQRRMKET